MMRRALAAVGDDDRIGVERADDGVGERHEHQADAAQEHQVVERRAPHRLLGAVGPAGAQVLADQRRGGVRHPERRHQREHHDADRDAVAGDGQAAEAGHHDRTSPTQLVVAIKIWKIPVARQPQDRRLDRRDRCAGARAAPPGGRARRAARAAGRSRRCRARSSSRSAAPVTPSLGNGPSPNTSNGPSTMLMPLARNSVRIATAGSPAPRNTALIRNSRMTVTLPPSMMRVKRPPAADHLGRRAHRGQQLGARRAPRPRRPRRPARRRARSPARRRAPRRRGPFRRCGGRRSAAPPIDSPIANE